MIFYTFKIGELQGEKTAPSLGAPTLDNVKPVDGIEGESKRPGPQSGSRLQGPAACKALWRPRHGRNPVKRGNTVARNVVRHPGKNAVSTFVASPSVGDNVELVVTEQPRHASEQISLTVLQDFKGNLRMIRHSAVINSLVPR